MNPPLLRIWRLPAVQALLLQCVAFIPTLSLTWLLARAGFAPGYLGVALAQGGFAAALTWQRGLAPWWRTIQFLFPLAVLGAGMLALPSWLFLAAFVFMLLLYWSTFRTQVPYFPSGRQAWDEVDRQLPAGQALNIIDIGSGLGGLVLELARRRPEARVSGIELAPLPWLVSLARARLSGSRACFLRGDYEQLDFARFDAVFAYLSPAAMSALWRKAAAEMRPGAMLMSYEFGIDEKAPDLCIAPQGGGPALYIWHF